MMKRSSKSKKRLPWPATSVDYHGDAGGRGDDGGGGGRDDKRWRW